MSASDEVKELIISGWGILLMLAFTALLVGLFYSLGVNVTRNELIRFVDLFFQVFLTLVAIMTSIGAVHLQATYREYAKLILKRHLSNIRDLTLLLLIISFVVRFVDLKDARIMAELAFLWLIMSILLVLYFSSNIRELFVMSPATIARMLSKNGKALADILKKSAGNPWDVFPYLYGMLDLINISFKEINPGDYLPVVTGEISKSIEYAEYWDPQWWRLHTWIQKDLLGPYLEALFKYEIPSAVINPLRSAYQKDPTLVFNFRTMFEKLGEMLVNNYFFIYPAFCDYIENLESLIEMDREGEYEKVKREVLFSALDKLLDFKLSGLERMKLNKSPQCEVVLKQIYNSIPEKIEGGVTSIPRIIKIALSYSKEGTGQYIPTYATVELHNKAIEVLKMYPQILTRMFDFDIEELPLGLETYDITVAFVEYVLKQWEVIHPNKADETIKRLAALFKKTKVFGYSVEVSGAILKVGNKEFELSTKEQIEFFKSAINKIRD